MKNYGFLKLVLSLLGICFIFMIAGIIFKIFRFAFSLAVFGFKSCLILLIIYSAYELIMYIYNRFKN